MVSFETEVTIDKVKELVLWYNKLAPSQVLMSKIEMTKFNTFKVTAELNLEPQVVPFVES